jgi:hypothetical protein
MNDADELHAMYCLQSSMEYSCMEPCRHGTLVSLVQCIKRGSAASAKRVKSDRWLPLLKAQSAALVMLHRPAARGSPDRRDDKKITKAEITYGSSTVAAR